MNTADIRGKSRFDGSRQSLHLLLIRSFCDYLNPEICFQYFLSASLKKRLSLSRVPSADSGITRALSKIVRGSYRSRAMDDLNVHVLKESRA